MPLQDLKENIGQQHELSGAVPHHNSDLLADIISRNLNTRRAPKIKHLVVYKTTTYVPLTISDSNVYDPDNKQMQMPLTLPAMLNFTQARNSMTFKEI